MKRIMPGYILFTQGCSLSLATCPSDVFKNLVSQGFCFLLVNSDVIYSLKYPRMLHFPPTASVHCSSNKQLRLFLQPAELFTVQVSASAPRWRDMSMQELCGIQFYSRGYFYCCNIVATLRVTEALRFLSMVGRAEFLGNLLCSGLFYGV